MNLVHNTLSRFVSDGQIAGCAVRIMRNDEVYYEESFGYADIERKIPMSSEDTIFPIASMSKVITVAGIMQLYEQGLFKMWDPVSKKMFGPDAGFQNVFYPKKRGEYRMDITACPYNRYFTELGTPELTKIFCINDECTYGDIPGLEFIRHTTLGTGGERCDFCIRVKRNRRNIRNKRNIRKRS